MTFMHILTNFRHLRVGHGSIFADPIQSNPKIAGIKGNS